MPISGRFVALSRGRLLLRTEAQIAATEVFVRAHLERVVKEVQTYPPVPPPPNHYKRTYFLFQSWQPVSVVRGGSQIAGTIRNLARYAALVQGQWQLPYHRAHGWKKLSDYLHRDEYVAGLRAIYATMKIGL